VERNFFRVWCSAESCKSLPLSLPTHKDAKDGHPIVLVMQARSKAWATRPGPVGGYNRSG
jgi:hypothetical protein